MERQRSYSSPSGHRSRSIFVLLVRLVVPPCLALLSSVVVVGSPQVNPRAARAGAIRGRVELRRVAAAPERRPNVADLGAPEERDLPDRLRSIVYLETAPRGAFEQPEAMHATLDQRNETFVPHVLAITTGREAARLSNTAK